MFRCRDTDHLRLTAAYFSCCTCTCCSYGRHRANRLKRWGFVLDFWCCSCNRSRSICREHRAISGKPLQLARPASFLSPPMLGSEIPWSYWPEVLIHSLTLIHTWLKIPKTRRQPPIKDIRPLDRRFGSSCKTSAAHFRSHPRPRAWIWIGGGGAPTWLQQLGHEREALSAQHPDARPETAVVIAEYIGSSARHTLF